MFRFTLEQFMHFKCRLTNFCISTNSTSLRKTQRAYFTSVSFVPHFDYI